jgi:hypothetical protein
MAETSRKSDIRSTNLGTIISFQAVTAKGSRWLRRHVPDARPYWHIDCDHRCGIDILEAMLAAGLVLEDARTGRQAVQS